MGQVANAIELYCPSCGYDLRQISSRRCPECGLEIDRSAIGQSSIPWVHRKTIGRRRAFWRTVEMAALRPEKLAREMNCPARLADAIKFRRIVVLHVLLPFGVILSYVWALWIGRLWVPTDALGSILQMMSLVVGWFCMASFLWGMTGAAGYFFRPAALSILRQNRAVALSYYVCGPLAYLPLTAFLATAATLIIAHASDTPIVARAVVGLIGVGPLLGNSILLIRSPFVLLRVILQGGQHFVLAAVLPVIWLLWAAATLILLPAIWIALLIMILSLRG